MGGYSYKSKLCKFVCITHWLNQDKTRFTMQIKCGYLLCICSLLFTISLSKDLNEGRYLKQNRFYRYAGIRTKIQSATPRLTRSSLKVEHKEKYLSPKYFSGLLRFLPAVLSKNEEKYPNKVSTSPPKGSLISESF